METASPTPKITIGILCYNAQHTISRAVECAFAQDYDNFEVIVVDDCSEDASVEQLKNIKGSQIFDSSNTPSTLGPVAPEILSSKRQRVR